MLNNIQDEIYGALNASDSWANQDGMIIWIGDNIEWILLGMFVLVVVLCWIYKDEL